MHFITIISRLVLWHYQLKFWGLLISIVRGHMCLQILSTFIMWIAQSCVWIHNITEWLCRHVHNQNFKCFRCAESWVVTKIIITWLLITVYVLKRWCSTSLTLAKTLFSLSVKLWLCFISSNLGSEVEKPWWNAFCHRKGINVNKG